ncbi:E3 ubiquitin-protein ligase MARCHF8-like isoform X2 [Cydia amplana]|uniref:E3 ubiquitin-protein ligase MARCHF8-like isoform X2 n=1 Tax=Cydia amplana TaxID=1869771 RepID=UPI002FE5956A
MENQDVSHCPEKEDTVKQQEDEAEWKIKPVVEDDAGPSQTSDLPGAIPFKANHPLKLSKSEQSIRQIYTHKDVAPLDLTSISFGPQVRDVNIANAKDLNVEETNKNDSMFVDIKNFMASYFRVDRENQVAVSEVQNTALSTVSAVQDTNCVTAAQMEDKPSAPANVIVTNQPAPDPNLSKTGSENKKKTSETLSERSGFAIVQRDSLSSIGSNVCRICMTRGRERLISPCNCKGSLANVHLTCLERWLNQVGRNHCELCGFSYPAIRTPRYTVLQALRLWFGNPRNRSHLQSDCLIFWLLSTVTAGLLAVCIVGTQYFVIEGNKFGISHRITETAMDFFMAIVLCGYSVTVYLLCKDHYVLWSRWRRANVHVRLLLSADADPVPFAPRPYNNIV